MRRRGTGMAGASAAGLVAAMLLAAMLAAGAVGPEPAAAHGLAPSLLDLRETSDHLVEVLWKQPAFRPEASALTPLLPPECGARTPGASKEAEGGAFESWTVECPAPGLVGRTVGVAGIERGGGDVLVRIALADGRVVKNVLRAGQTHLTVPARVRPLDVLWEYARLGLEHILSGPDHLLFVLGLLLLVGGRMLVRTITAFTAGHSVTLSLAVLGLANVPQRPVEVGIALSVFVLAVELSRASPAPTPLRRAPWAMAFAFGLLHGLGFAGALSEAGLPAGEIPTALLAFNVGIELGQLAVVCPVLVAGRIVVGRLLPNVERLRWIPTYAMGSLSAFWCLERLAVMLRV